MSSHGLRGFDEIPLLSARTRLDYTLLLRRDPLAFMRELGGGGGVFRVPLLDKHAVVVTDPALVQEALVERAPSTEKGALMRYVLYPVIGEGLFNSRGELWRRQRRLMAPIFRPGQIAGYGDAMVECALRDVSSWRDGETRDLARETMRIAMSVAGRTLFGAETFSEADEIGAALTVAIRWAGERVTSLRPIAQIALREALARASPALPARLGALSRGLAERLHGPVLLWGDDDRRMRSAVALLDRRVQRMIDERRASGAYGEDLLGRLLTAQDEDDGAVMSDRQVRDEVLTLFVAGHETTATSLAWSLYLLARHPAVYARARAEADALGRPPRHEDLPRLGLAQRVFKEALRLMPPVPMFLRDARDGLDLGGYRLPPGSVMVLSPYITHRRADLWPDPERFDPERFTPEAEASRSKHAFIPFSGGPRVCIGNHFALMEGALVLATLLQRADFELVTDAPVEPEVHATLRPKGGVPMRVRLRHASA